MKSSILEIKLGGGLCNKLFCLFSACDIAIRNKIKLLEPTFGWKKEIMFSDIYDIDFFNEKMREYNDGQDIMVSIKDKNNYDIQINKVNLWQYSENILNKQRNNSMMDIDCMNIRVLQALKLNESNLKIVNSIQNIEKKNGIHFRIERDWIGYSKKKEKKLRMNNQLCYVNPDYLINLYKKKWLLEDVFFTTGEKQEQIVYKFKKKNISSQYIFINKLEYEINAAINFELCCRTKIFIGLTKSTFSNLITLKRYLLGKNESYIYNILNDIIIRIDKGLHPCPVNATTKNVIIDKIDERNILNPIILEEKKKFNVVYFACLILDWERVCKNNVKTIFESNILNDENCRSFTIVFTGDKNNISILQEIFNNDKFIFEYMGNNIKSNEYYGIKKIKDLAKLYPKDNLLYFHSKGITRNGIADDWVTYLEYFNVINYKTCLEKLENHDVVGTEYLSRPRKHFGGNFWWATSKHINRLILPRINSERHRFEFFILTQRKIKIWNFHNSTSNKFPGFNVKRRKYLLEEYNNINQGKTIYI